MKVLVVAINMKVGGGVTVTKNFLKIISTTSAYSNQKYHVLVPPNIGYEDYDKNNVQIEIVARYMLSPLLRLFLDYFWFKKKIVMINPDVIFTMGNIAIPTFLPQAVIFHFPYAIYPNEKEVWKRLSSLKRIDFRLRNYVFAKRLKYVDVLLPQTNSSAARLAKYYDCNKIKINIVPNSFYPSLNGFQEFDFFDKKINYKYLICLSKYYSHKNIEILLPLAKKIKATKSNFKIIITIDKSQDSKAKLLLEKIKLYNLDDIIINIGQIPINSIPSVYKKVDGLLMPTLMESFSATYIDAMYYGVPVFTSYFDFAFDVCGNSAFYFNPLDADDIYRVISDAYSDQKKINESISNEKKIIEKFPSWNDVVSMYVNTLIEITQDC